MAEPEWPDYVRQARHLMEGDPENRNGHMVSVPAWMLVQRADDAELIRRLAILLRCVFSPNDSAKVDELIFAAAERLLKEPDEDDDSAGAS